MTSGGFAASSLHSHEQAKYDGEFSGSILTLSNGELNEDNVYKYSFDAQNILNVLFVTSSNPGPTPTPTPTHTPTPTPTSTTFIASQTPTPTPTQTNTPTPSPTTPSLIDIYTRIIVNQGGSTSYVGDYEIESRLDTESTWTSVGLFGHNAFFQYKRFNVPTNTRLSFRVTRTGNNNAVQADTTIVYEAYTGTGTFFPLAFGSSPNVSYTEGDSVNNEIFTVQDFSTNSSPFLTKLQIQEG